MRTFSGRRKGPWTVMVAVILLLPVLFLGLAQVCPNASAAKIVFVITHEEVHVYVEKDGSVDIQYDLHITVRPQSDTIYDLTIHMPNWQFDEEAISVTLDSEPVQGVRRSDRSDKDIMISFNSVEALKAGTSHVLILVVNVKAVVVPHPSDDDMARLKITPTWWDPDRVQAVQRLDVHIHLPEGYLDEANVDHTKGATILEVNDRLVLSWSEEDVPPDERRTYRVDFPASAVDSLHDPFWDEVLHYYLTYIVLAAVLILVVVLAVVVKRALRKPYVKPYLDLENWGPRKGFGPMEAALALGLEHERVVIMFLIDLVMVGALRIKDPKKMVIEVTNLDYEGRSAPLMGCIRDGRLVPIATSNMIHSLNDEVEARMVGYDRDGTIAYYRAQAPKRWSKVRAKRTPSADNVLWMLTDPEARKKFKEIELKDVPAWTRWKVKI